MKEQERKSHTTGEGEKEVCLSVCLSVCRSVCLSVSKAKVGQNSINIHRACPSVRPSVRPSCFHLSSTRDVKEEDGTL